MACMCEEYLKLEPNSHEDCYDLVRVVYCDHMGSTEQELLRIPCVDLSRSALAQAITKLISLPLPYEHIANDLLATLAEGRVPRVVINRSSCPYCNNP